MLSTIIAVMEGIVGLYYQRIVYLWIMQLPDKNMFLLRSERSAALVLAPNFRQARTKDSSLLGMKEKETRECFELDVAYAQYLFALDCRRH